jgi:4-amino-4-deoxy-L-arabinose transferase-like glycosyltransferase
MPRSTVVRPPDPTLRSALWLATFFALAKLLLHIGTTLWQRHIGVGYFRDEFYYLMCGRHLAWGYVDHGPIVAVQARIAETLFGHSLLGIRMLSMLAGAGRVFLTGLLCWSLGGKRAAQSLAMLSCLCIPLYLGVDSYLSMNSWEGLFWMTCLLSLIMMFRDEAESINRRWMWWTVFGISAGIGLLNKPSMVFFLVCLALALLLTPQRRILFTKQAVFGIILLTLITTPNLLWQIHNHWPTLEFLHNGRVEGKNVKLNPLSWILNQLVVIGPWNALVWVAGLVHLLRRADLRWLGLTWLILLALMIAMGAKDYYFAPIYPILFAAGGIAWANRFASRRAVQEDRVVAFPVAFATIIVLTALVLPTAIFVLPPMTFVAYTKALHLPTSDSENTGGHQILPQFYADRYGWQENLDEVTRILNMLSPEERAKAGIMTGNYGGAASLEWLGDLERRNLPPVVAKHNNYWIWGPHGLTGDVMIIDRNISIDELREYYSDIQVVGRVDHPLSMWYERHNIYLVRHRKMPLAQDWAAHKFFF